MGRVLVSKDLMSEDTLHCNSMLLLPFGLSRVLLRSEEGGSQGQDYVGRGDVEEGAAEPRGREQDQFISHTLSRVKSQRQRVLITGWMPRVGK